MSTMIGKRKRDVARVSREEQDAAAEEQKHKAPKSDTEDYLSIMRKAFEAQFAPLDPSLMQPVQTEPSDAVSSDESEGRGAEDEDDDGEWSGLSDDESGDESEPVAEVVDHTRTGKKPENLDLPDREVRKAFMTTKPPKFEAPKPSKPKQEKKSEEEENIDAMHLKNDLALQRLLKESHLLEDASDLNPFGVNRHKALDLRMQELGAKNSLFKQEKMPMSHRKGIITKSAQKEEIRRREAKENGIILEKPIKQKSKNTRRERGIGGPAVGKFAGGTLRLSQRDVAAISGPKRSVGGKKGGKGKRR